MNKKQEFYKKMDELIKCGILVNLDNERVGPGHRNIALSKEFRMALEENVLFLKPVVGLLKALDQALVLTIFQMVKRGIDMDDLTDYYRIVVSVTDLQYREAIKKYGKDKVDGMIGETYNMFKNQEVVGSTTTT